MGHRIAPALLAGVGFLATFTIRSWQEGLWHPGDAADYVMVSLPRQTGTAQKTSIAVTPLASTPSLASVPAQVTGRPRAAPISSVASTAAPATASAFLAERAREASHSARMR